MLHYQLHSGPTTAYMVHPGTMTKTSLTRSRLLQALLLGHPNKLIRDTSKYPPLMRPGGPGRKPKPKALRHLAFEQLGLGIQSGEHSPVEDARATLYLYQLHAKVMLDWVVPCQSANFRVNLLEEIWSAIFSIHTLCFHVFQMASPF